MTYKPRCLECGSDVDYWRGFKVCEYCFGTMADPYKHIRPGSSRALCRRCEMMPASQFSKNKLCGQCMMDKTFENALDKRQRKKEEQRRRRNERRKKQRQKERKRKDKEKKRKQKDKKPTEPDMTKTSLLSWLFPSRAKYYT